MGDEVQAIKAGLLEVADIVVVNKGDKPGAQRTAAQLRAMLVPDRSGAARAARRPSRTRTGPRPKRPEVLVTTATTGEGVPELLAALDRHRARGATRRGDARRGSRAPRPRSGRSSRDRLRATCWSPRAGDHRGDRCIEEVAAHRLDPFAAADRLLGAARRPTGSRRRSTDRRRRPADPTAGSSPGLRRRCSPPSSRSSSPAASVLPVAPRFTAGPLGADAIGRRHRASARSRSPRSLLRPVVGWASDRFGRRPLLIARRR